MKKSLTFILIILLVILAVQMVVNGIKIGDFEILSIKQLQEENLELDDKILQAEKLTNTTYNAEYKKLNDQIKTLQNEKNRYEELVKVTSESNYALASREQNYKVEYLYYQIGEIAKKNEVDLKIEISTSSSGLSDLYDVTLITSYEAPVTDESGYVRLTDFIYDVENDSTLGFKVEDFSLVPYSVASKTITTKQEVTNPDGTVSTVTVNNVVQWYGLRGTFTAKNLSIQDIAEIISKDNTTNNTTDTTGNTVSE